MTTSESPSTAPDLVASLSSVVAGVGKSVGEYAYSTFVPSADSNQQYRSSLPHPDFRPPTLYLIRHGESQTNNREVAAFVAGDPGLSKLGFHQARALRSVFDTWNGRPQPSLVPPSSKPAAAAATPPPPTTSSASHRRTHSSTSAASASADSSLSSSSGKNDSTINSEDDSKQLADEMVAPAIAISDSSDTDSDDLPSKSSVVSGRRPARTASISSAPDRCTLQVKEKLPARSSSCASAAASPTSKRASCSATSTGAGAPSNLRAPQAPVESDTPQKSVSLGNLFSYFNPFSSYMMTSPPLTPIPPHTKTPPIPEEGEFDACPEGIELENKAGEGQRDRSVNQQPGAVDADSIEEDDIDDCTSFVVHDDISLSPSPSPSPTHLLTVRPSFNLKHKRVESIEDESPEIIPRPSPLPEQPGAASAVQRNSNASAEVSSLLQSALNTSVFDGTSVSSSLHKDACDEDDEDDIEDGIEIVGEMLPSSHDVALGGGGMSSSPPSSSSPPPASAVPARNGHSEKDSSSKNGVSHHVHKNGGPRRSLSRPVPGKVADVSSIERSLHVNIVSESYEGRSRKSSECDNSTSTLDILRNARGREGGDHAQQDSSLALSRTSTNSRGDEHDSSAKNGGLWHTEEPPDGDASSKNFPSLSQRASSPKKHHLQLSRESAEIDHPLALQSSSTPPKAKANSVPTSPKSAPASMHPRQSLSSSSGSASLSDPSPSTSARSCLLAPIESPKKRSQSSPELTEGRDTALFKSSSQPGKSGRLSLSQPSDTDPLPQPPHTRAQSENHTQSTAARVQMRVASVTPPPPPDSELEKTEGDFGFLTDAKIDAILISPLRRTLHTAFTAFDVQNRLRHHSNFPTCEVVPELREAAMSRADLGSYRWSLEREFPFFVEPLRRSLPANDRWWQSTWGIPLGPFSNTEKNIGLRLQLFSDYLLTERYEGQNLVIVGHSFFFLHFLKTKTKMKNCAVVKAEFNATTGCWEATECPMPGAPLASAFLDH